MTKQKMMLFILTLTPLFVAMHLFGFTLNYYFFQDDWFNFNITNINSIKDYLNFFAFRDDIIAYRPLVLQTQYFLFRSIFGLNAFALRVINFSLLFISYILVMYLARRILKNSKSALFTAALWVTSSFHYMNLGMINYHLWGTVSWLITFLLFMGFLETKKKTFYLLSIVLYLVSLGIWEFAVSWPIIGTAYIIYVKRLKIIITFKIFSPFYLITTVYLIIRHFLVAHLSIIEYQVAFNLDSIKALFWYILWALNVPEEFKKQIADNLIIFRAEFLRDYWQLVSITLIGAILLIILGIFYPCYKAFRSKTHINFKLMIFFLFWFGVAIFPALLLPNHNFMMYLTLPSLALYLMISYLTFKARNKYLSYVIFSLWIILSLITVRFYKINMFSSVAQRVSEDFVINMKRNYPNLQPNSIVYYPLPFRRDQQALLNQNAIQALYKDQTINIFYTYGSMIKFWKSTNEKRPVLLY